MSSSDYTADGANPAFAANWERFTYLGARSRHRDRAAQRRRRDPRQLANAEPGDRLCVTALHCGENNRRLRGMGLLPGSELEVVNRNASGSTIVNLDGRQLGLAAELATNIHVEPVAAATTAAHPPTPEVNTMPNTQIALRQAAIGSHLRVVGYEPTARAYKHKLLAMGLTPGTEFTVTRHAPLGDPTEIEVRDYQLSLRKDEADALQVEPVVHQ